MEPRCPCLLYQALVISWLPALQPQACPSLPHTHSVQALQSTDSSQKVPGPLPPSYLFCIRVSLSLEFPLHFFTRLTPPDHPSKLNPMPQNSPPQEVFPDFRWGFPRQHVLASSHSFSHYFVRVCLLWVTSKARNALKISVSSGSNTGPGTQ